MTVDPLLELRKICLFEEGLPEIRDLDFTLERGEIHALIGDRGTGKSTIGMLMALNQKPSGGTILWENREIRFRRFQSMQNPGVQILFQNEGLIDYFTVAENMFLPEKIFRPFPFNGRKKMYQQAQKIIGEYGFDLDPHNHYAGLTMSEKVVLDFLHCIYREPKLLIIDEALARLNGAHFDKVIKILKQKTREGLAVICISHRIDDVYDLADKISVIRDGKILLTDTTGNMDRLNLIKLCYTQVARSTESEDLNKEFYQLLRYNEAILKNLPITLIVTDDNNRIKMINDQGMLFFHSEPEEFLNRPLDVIIPDTESLERICQCFNRNEESNLLHLKIGEVLTNIKIYPIFDGRFPIGNITIIEDITEQEEMRQRMNLSENLASLGLLAAGVAHEINNPLEIIYNYLSFLRMNPSREKASRVVHMLEEEMDGIKHIVSNLVSFSGSKESKATVFDVNQLIRQTVTLLEPSAGERNIQCRFNSSIEEIFIEACKTEIRQVLLNLIKNSFEVLPEGGYVDIETMTEKEALILLIRDNGPGISERDGESIFLPFYSTKKENTGSNMGLGLPMSYGIIRKYKGEMQFRNLERGGCEFKITIPILES